MDNNIKFVRENRINRTIEALRKNNMGGVYCESFEDLKKELGKIIKEDDVVTVGGSMTLFQSGVIETLRTENVTFLDRYQEGLTSDDIRRIYVQAFDSDIYFTSSNAVTESGFLYNVDGRGNRVAAITYGPKKVVVVVGYNKIVKDVQEAVKRNEELAAPANAKRLKRKTPCAVDGICRECSSPERICCSYVLTKKQMESERITVIIVNEELGY